MSPLPKEPFATQVEGGCGTGFMQPSLGQPYASISTQPTKDISKLVSGTRLSLLLLRCELSIICSICSLRTLPEATYRSTRKDVMNYKKINW